ncbi:MAG: aminomethyl-transferring glycine dehydrogenase subunit GcvPA [Deltaproteobacteria bacterium]|nr:aminomethyl-transferring glycine dehydrogenase subunit GcvPA [Deltaproteobacteria bacterium]MBW1928622.1 aminomethyl-transferring glycine dehydrogenase subunit GcvPA [Deltaproteobacteria bacterium]
MRYLPHTEKEITEMLQAIGLDSLDDLFETIPKDCRRADPLNLPEPLTEWELDTHMEALAAQMAVAPEYKVFLGAGSYHHFIPEAVKQLLLRSEFYTAYTPYQPEVSQGTLQAIYEYQTLVTLLLGMEVANASMYDGASALAEALLMAIRITKRKKVAVSRLIHPYYRQVVQTYLEAPGFEIVELPFLDNGTTDLSGLDGLEEFAAVAVQSPNFFGCIEDLQAHGQRVHSDPKTLFVVAFTEPLAYGLLKPPGDFGADIVCGEGQSLGSPQSFGGPGLGMFASKAKYVRSMPGRLVGQTIDKDGRRGFVLTLATREQHIRRERATSNICSNQGLCALASAMYMATLGKSGIRELAALNHDKAEYLKKGLREAGISLPFDDTPTFNEFVAKFGPDFKEKYGRLLEKRIVAGLPIESFYPELPDHYLLCATETTAKEDMDVLIKEVRS